PVSVDMTDDALEKKDAVEQDALASLETQQYPDPLDLMPQGKEEDTKSESPSKEESNEKEATETVEGKTQAEPVVDETELTDELAQAPSVPIDDSSEPLESLFLPNVKVEKRPLGVADSNLDGDKT